MAGGVEIDFVSWREGFRRALAEGGTSDVPCGGCTACCRSHQFVHIEPEEADTLAHIDPALLVPAPGGPPGHMVMGYDTGGRCPMLGPDGCRIYEHRPRTCRTYDCRVFAAAGVEPDQPPVARRVLDWHFLPGEEVAAVARDAARLQEEGVGATEAALRAVTGGP